MTVFRHHGDIWWSSSWDESASLNCKHQLVYCSSLRWYMSIENDGGMMSTVINSWFLHQSSLVILLQSLLVAKQEELVKEMMSLALRSIFVYISKESLTWHKVLRHGAGAFTSPQKQGVLRIFIALKNPLPLTGFEPVNLGSVGKHANHYTTEDDMEPLVFYTEPVRHISCHSHTLTVRV
jgi:hypothetical protein